MISPLWLPMDSMRQCMRQFLHHQLLNFESSKRSLNVDSPAFTPTPKIVQPAKVGISPKAVAAATFTPRGSGEFDQSLSVTSVLTRSQVR